jgi:AraC family transcriptional regulator
MSDPLVHLYFWQGEALYVGLGLDSTWHRHHAVQMGFSLGAPFAVRQKPDQLPTPCMAFIAPSHVSHQVYSAGVPSIFVWVEKESLVATAITSRYPDQEVTILPDEFCRQILFDPIKQFDCSTARHFLGQIYHHICNAQLPPDFIDARIQVVVEQIKNAHRGDTGVVIHQLATHVYLSPSRLRHLFRKQVGISIQQYLLWQKLMTALAVSLRGASLTEAAHEAGFSDSAHFSRTFRQMFGIKPSEIFGNSHYVQVNAC